MVKPWEETWAQDPAVPRYVMKDPDAGSHTILMAMDLRRPADEAANIARAQLAATAPEQTRHLLHLLSEYKHALPDSLTESIRATLRSGGVPT